MANTARRVPLRPRRWLRIPPDQAQGGERSKGPGNRGAGAAPDTPERILARATLRATTWGVYVTIFVGLVAALIGVGTLPREAPAASARRRLGGGAARARSTGRPAEAGWCRCSISTRRAASSSRRS